MRLTPAFLILVTAALLGLAWRARPAGAAESRVADTLRSDADRTTLSRAGRTLAHLGSDGWYILSSPVRLNHRGALVTLGVLATTGVLYAYDGDLTKGFHRSRENPIYEAVIDVGNAIEPVGHMGKTNIYYLGAAALGYVMRWEPLQRVPLDILESHLIAGGFRNGAKLLIGRRREFEREDPYFFEFNGGTSFPSGHASVVFELATILTHHTKSPIVGVATYGLATTVALQRVDSRSHWPSDVFIAAAAGTLIARTVVRRNEERRERRARIGLDPSGRGVSIAVSF